MGKKDRDRDYDDDDDDIRSLGVDTGQAYCTECCETYDLSNEKQVNKHAH